MLQVFVAQQVRKEGVLAAKELSGGSSGVHQSGKKQLNAIPLTFASQPTLDLLMSTIVSIIREILSRNKFAVKKDLFAILS